jgi:hypothetical protein
MVEVDGGWGGVQGLLIMSRTKWGVGEVMGLCLSQHKLKMAVTIIGEYYKKISMQKSDP